jgi:RNase P/RNase MRP subunit p29
VRAEGDWDIGALQKGQGMTESREAELSADAKAWTEIQAANMIIKERMNAYTKDLTALQAKLEGLNERVVEAEQQYVVRHDSSRCVCMPQQLHKLRVHAPQLLTLRVHAHAAPAALCVV